MEETILSMHAQESLKALDAFRLFPLEEKFTLYSECLRYVSYSFYTLDPDI